MSGKKIVDQMLEFRSPLSMEPGDREREYKEHYDFIMKALKTIEKDLKAFLPKGKRPEPKQLIRIQALRNKVAAANTVI